MKFQLFVNSYWGIFLLLLQFTFILVFYHLWCYSYGYFINLLFPNGLSSIWNTKKPNDVKIKSSNSKITQGDIILIMMTGNFVGICFSRTLHYQVKKKMN